MTRECIQSLFSDEGDSFEILIVDNGSRTARWRTCAMAFPQIAMIANGQQPGIRSGSNVGMKRALDQAMDYVLLVNNDTVVKPDLLAELLAESKRTRRLEWSRRKSTTLTILIVSGGREARSVCGRGFPAISAGKKKNVAGTKPRAPSTGQQVAWC